MRPVGGESRVEIKASQRGTQTALAIPGNGRFGVRLGSLFGGPVCCSRFLKAALRLYIAIFGGLAPQEGSATLNMARLRRIIFDAVPVLALFPSYSSA